MEAAAGIDGVNVQVTALKLALTPSGSALAFAPSMFCGKLCVATQCNPFVLRRSSAATPRRLRVESNQ
jgi:hypothetical protein